MNAHGIKELVHYAIMAVWEKNFTCSFVSNGLEPLPMQLNAH